MKLAIIDIGSNSVRLLLATYENNIWHYEPKQLWTTRLGQRNSDGTLRTESMEASYQAFTDIKKLADQLEVPMVFEQGPGKHDDKYCDMALQRILDWMDFKGKAGV